MMYQVKIDDLLINMLKDYHEIEPSEVFSFFGARLKEASTKDANITTKSRLRNIKNRDRPQQQLPSMVKFSVLRGFYPNTKIPFKLVAVLPTMFTGDHTPPYAKVSFGVKDEFTIRNNIQIDEYDIAIAEAILLDKEIDEDKKVKYTFKPFKCMRPKGMLLYKKGK